MEDTTENVLTPEQIERGCCYDVTAEWCDSRNHTPIAEIVFRERAAVRAEMQSKLDGATHAVSDVQAVLERVAAQLDTARLEEACAMDNVKLLAADVKALRDQLASSLSAEIASQEKLARVEALPAKWRAPNPLYVGHGFANEFEQALRGDV